MKHRIKAKDTNNVPENETIFDMRNKRLADVREMNKEIVNCFNDELRLLLAKYKLELYPVLTFTDRGVAQASVSVRRNSKGTK